MPARSPNNLRVWRTDEAKAIPDSQNRALERRQELDRQQREFQENSSPTPPARRRPPG